MVTDYYNNVYRKKVNHKGSSLKEKAVDRGVRDFNKYLAVTPTRQEVFLNDSIIAIGVSIQNSMQNLVGDRYEKNILGSLDDNLKIGDLIKWNDDYWLIVTEERLVIPTHFKGKIRFCNHYLKWNHQGIVHNVPAHVITSRAFALSEGQKAGLTFEEGGMVVLAMLPHNEVTTTISRYHRFIIKERAWKVVSTDILSVDNLMFIRLEEDQINLAKDDLNEGIADRFRPGEDTSQEIEGYVYEITGEDKIVSNQSSEYIATRDGETEGISVVFSIDDPVLATLAVENTENPTIVKANSSGIVGTVTLSCEFIDTGQTITKSIKVTSLWGG
jgi:hypothetical protein